MLFSQYSVDMTIVNSLPLGLQEMGMLNSGSCNSWLWIEKKFTAFYGFLLNRRCSWGFTGKSKALMDISKTVDKLNTLVQCKTTENHEYRRDICWEGVLA